MAVGHEKLSLHLSCSLLSGFLHAFSPLHDKWKGPSLSLHSSAFLNGLPVTQEFLDGEIQARCSPPTRVGVTSILILCRIQNMYPKSEIQNPESAQKELLHNAPKSKIRNPRSKIRNPKSKIQNRATGGLTKTTPT